MKRKNQTKSDTMDSPIKWMGGKSQLRQKIIRMMPEHRCYVEPFFGAGWVYFGKYLSKVEVINDINSELITFFKVVRNNWKDLIEIMKYDICSRELYDAMLNANVKAMTDIERARRFYYLIYNGFGGQFESGFGYSKAQKPGFDPKNALRMIEQAHTRLRNTYVENLDYGTIIEKYDSKETLFFLDPPYYETAGYGSGFDIYKQTRLCERLKELQGKFILTINDHETIRDLYKDFNVERVSVTYVVGINADSRKEYGELIITNFKRNDGMAKWMK